MFYKNIRFKIKHQKTKKKKKCKDAQRYSPPSSVEQVGLPFTFIPFDSLCPEVYYQKREDGRNKKITLKNNADRNYSFTSECGEETLTFASTGIGHSRHHSLFSGADWDHDKETVAMGCHRQQMKPSGQQTLRKIDDNIAHTSTTSDETIRHLFLNMHKVKLRNTYI
ncbi:hypothetical protein AVEN_57967-1 [Araneus ventricosus]|uniref:Uncharacterized protein n=1 Tax=Araneus ventricosus TaxID=182803 RepID=A0A4Y1ZPL5_ARAVE|nr:hypothetical protein AVEN_2939-1 [Araneus ventricosus]GBL60843.1 hypothetical protein AVEN_57967-1 [Araneus ventricosus]